MRNQFDKGMPVRVDGVVWWRCQGVTVFGGACDVEGWREGRVVTKEESCGSRRILEI